MEEPSKDDKSGVVWAFKTAKDHFAAQSFDPLKITLTKIFRPPHIVPRIRAQSGYFTAHALLKSGSFLIFETHKKYNTNLTKLLVPAKHFAAIRHDLDILGVNRAFIYSDIDGLAQHIGWLNQLLDDEK